MNKVIDQRSDGIAKSALKSNGVDSDDDAKSIIAAWKQQRETAQQQTAETLTSAQQENATLKAQILQMQISTVAQTQAAKMGIDVNSLPYITKLADFGDAMNEKGDPDPEKINAALQKVIDDIPAFRKTAAEQKGFVKVGGDGGKDETATEAEQKLRKAFGLK
ncbi:MAG: hypothetical protein PHX61_10900 [Alphaproteobacteria bacterium]|nr:hypothetical protein [Alphaproteobacteria bacterium]